VWCVRLVGAGSGGGFAPGRYVTPAAFRESAIVALGTADFGSPGVSFTMQARARLALFSPGAPLARKLAQNPTVLLVNDTVFAHGGLLPVHGAPHPKK